MELLAEDGGSIPVQGLLAGDVAYLLAQVHRPRWADTAEAVGWLTFRLPGDVGWRTGHVVAIGEAAEARRVRGQFAAGLGPGDYDRHFRAEAAVFRLDVASAREELPGGSGAGAAFDGIASDYARRVRDEPFQRYLRQRGREILFRSFPEPARLIELGPGSGAQTLPMLRAGHAITAVDPSARMLEQLVGAARLEGLDQRLQVRQGTFGGLGQVLHDEAEGGFEGAYSMFGALNLEPQLREAAPDIRRLLSPKGRLVAGFSNRWAVVPALAFAASGDFGRVGEQARWWLGRAVPRLGLAVHPVSAGQLGGLFRPWLETLSLEAVSVFVPPFPSDSICRYFGPRGLSRLAAVDRSLCRHPLIARLAEHLVLTLSKGPGQVQRRAGPI